MPPRGYRTKARLWRLESRGSFQRPPSDGGLEGACWAPLPRGEGPKPGWRIHSDCPPQWWKTVPLLIPFFLRQALQGWAGWGQVWGSSWGVWRRGGGVEEIGMSQHTRAHAQTHAWEWTHSCMRINVHKAAPSVLVLSWFRPLPTHTHNFFSFSPRVFSSIPTHTRPLSPYCPLHIGMSYILHSLSLWMKKRKERRSWSSYSTGLQPLSNSKCEIEADNSRRYAERNKTVITGIGTKIWESSGDIKPQIISL